MLRLELDGKIAQILIDRPSKRNAMTMAMWQDMPVLIATAMNDPAVRVVVLTSASPGDFCSGADIGELSRGSQDPDWRRANRLAIRGTQLALVQAPTPTVAIIDGDCIGGGLGMAIACDLRIASPRARFGLPPAKLGLAYPLHDLRLLQELVGLAQTKRLIYTGDLIKAAEAMRIGLIEFQTPDLASEALQLTGRIARLSGASHRSNKHLLERIRHGQVDDDSASDTLFERAFSSADFKEGLSAFMSKREATFD